MRRDGTVEDLLQRPGPLAILLVLLHRGLQSFQQLEDAVGVQSGTIRYHVSALEQAGVVTVDPSTKPKILQLADPRMVPRLLDKARPGWAEGGIPHGALWREVQAAIDTRRVRATYHTRIAFQRRRLGFLATKRK